MLHTAINALRTLTPFRHVSARLLADLATLGRAVEVRSDKPSSLKGGIVLAVEGAVELRGAPPATVDTTTERAWAASGIVLSPGEGRLFDLSLRSDAQFEARAVGAEPARIMVLDQETLRQSIDGSFVLAWNLRAYIPDDGRRWIHALWLTEAPVLHAPLAVLAEFLAESLAMQFNEPAAIVTIPANDGVVITKWADGKFVEVKYKPAPEADRLDEIAALLPKGTHVIFVDPLHPDMMPPLFDTIRFHRIIYLCMAAPDSVPPHLQGRLREEVLVRGVPYFSSFVPTVVSTPPVPLHPTCGSLLSAPFDALLGVVRRVFAEPFRTEPVREDRDDDRHHLPPTAEQQLHRDTVRLRVEFSAVRRWASPRPSNPSPPSADAALEREKVRNAGLAWARAASNRRVGLALSGGGACSFRLVPFLEQLQTRGVPVDILTGLSGGALLGAYFCEGGAAKLGSYVAHGPLIGLIAFLAAFDSRWIAWFVDYELHGARLDDLPVEFAPLTTALLDTTPPEARYLSSGSLGDAVRASGALPIFVAPVDVAPDLRFVDGGTASPLPVDALRDRGADIMIACNAVPGPENRNPFRGYLPGRLAYRWTLAGRVIDLWVSGAFMLQQISRKAGKDAHAFVEVPPDALSLMEMFQFYKSRRLADPASDPDLAKKVQRCVDAWMSVGGQAPQLSP
jgi:predicted acylesterase/phospholipase RssA